MVLRKLSQQILSRTCKFRKYQSKRGNADWYRPRFKGGEAQPHELGRLIRQAFYTDGEKIFGFGFIFIAPFIYLLRYIYDVEWRKRNEDWCNRNAELFRIYPEIYRDES